MGGKFGIEKRGIPTMTAVHGKFTGEGQTLVDVEQKFARCNEAVLTRAVALLAGFVLKRALHVQTVEVVVETVGMLGIPDWGIGRSIDYGQDYTAAVTYGTHGTAAVRRIVGVHNVGLCGKPLAKFAFHVGAEVEALEERALEYTLVALVAARQVIAYFVGALRHSQLIGLSVAGAVSFVKPVGLIGEAVGQFHKADFIHKLLVLCCIEHIDFFSHLGETALYVQRYPGIAAAALLGRDNHNSVGTARTVDSGRRGVLENLHALDVAGRKEVYIVHRHTVNNIQRFVRTVERGGTAHTHSHAAAGSAGGLLYRHTGSLTLDSLGSRHNGAVGKCFLVDCRHCCSKVFTLYRAVTDNHNFVEVGYIFGKGHIHGRRSGQLAAHISNIGENKSCAFRHLDAEIAVDVGGCTGTGPVLDFHAYAD